MRAQLSQRGDDVILSHGAKLIYDVNNLLTRHDVILSLPPLDADGRYKTLRELNESCNCAVVVKHCVSKSVLWTLKLIDIPYKDSARTAQ
jgi:hypothetical protein